MKKNTKDQNKIICCVTVNSEMPQKLRQNIPSHQSWRRLVFPEIDKARFSLKTFFRTRLAITFLGKCCWENYIWEIFVCEKLVASDFDRWQHSENMDWLF